MNTAQKIILVIGVVFAVDALLFVPWNHVADDGEVKPAGYSFIWRPPTVSERHSADVLGVKVTVSEAVEGNQIDYGRVGLELAIIALLTGGLFAVVGDRKRPQVRMDERSEPPKMAMSGRSSDD